MDTAYRVHSPSPHNPLIRSVTTLTFGLLVDKDQLINASLRIANRLISASNLRTHLATKVASKFNLEETRTRLMDNKILTEKELSHSAYSHIIHAPIEFINFIVKHNIRFEDTAAQRNMTRAITIDARRPCSRQALNV